MRSTSAGQNLSSSGISFCDMMYSVDIHRILLQLAQMNWNPRHHPTKYGFRCPYLGTPRFVWLSSPLLKLLLPSHNLAVSGIETLSASFMAIATEHWNRMPAPILWKGYLSSSTSIYCFIPDPGLLRFSEVWLKPKFRFVVQGWRVVERYHSVDRQWWSAFWRLLGFDHIWSATIQPTKRLWSLPSTNELWVSPWTVLTGRQGVDFWRSRVTGSAALSCTSIQWGYILWVIDETPQAFLSLSWDNVCFAGPAAFRSRATVIFFRCALYNGLGHPLSSISIVLEAYDSGAVMMEFSTDM